MIQSTAATRDLLGQLMGGLERDGSDGTGWTGPDTVRSVHTLHARDAATAPWPEWVPADLRDAAGRQGIDTLWSHQEQAAQAAWQGRHVVQATGTASGKSLGYLLPSLSALLTDPRATTLYLSPTKALAADQLAALSALSGLPGCRLPGLRAATFDGDTPLDERDWVREHARFVLTNPDMLHRTVLPGHARWQRFLRHLKFIVVDECHGYRGLFGAHVGLVLRRLRRLAARYGARPVMLLASATIADPGRSAAALIGDRVEVVDVDGSPSPGADVVLTEPAVISDAEPGDGGDLATPRRRPVPVEAAELLGRLTEAGCRSLAFVRSRHGAESVAMAARQWLADYGTVDPQRIAAYRGGYLPEERRRLEADIATGRLRALATTNALELGIDISGLDAVVIAGFPGSIASWRQQAGRAGRVRDRALVVFVARPDPLDTYLVQHPQALLDRTVEATVLDPANPRILARHLRCAAAESPVTEADLDLFGGPDAVLPVLADLVRERALRRRPGGWYAELGDDVHDEVDLRGSGGQQVLIADGETGRLLGTVDAGRAPAQVYPGAVHLHRGISYLVDDLDLESGIALVHPEQPDFSTVARSVSSVDLLPAEDPRRDLSSTVAPGITAGIGPVRVTEQVVGYARLRHGKLLDVTPLDLPPSILHTRACWYSVEPELLSAIGVDDVAVAGALHAAEHAAIGLLPLFTGCDRSDIGGLSTALHPDTGLPTVIVHEGIDGGAGFTDRAYVVLGQWLRAVADAVRTCPCRTGCPSCIQSPKCGNGNHPLHKSGAVKVLDLVAGALGH